MAEWVRQQAEREAEKEQKRLERLQRKLAEPRPCSANPAYQRQCHEMAERLEDSVLKGERAVALSGPRRPPRGGQPSGRREPAASPLGSSPRCTPQSGQHPLTRSLCLTPSPGGSTGPP